MADATITHTYGIDTVLPTNVLKTGYAFAGWYENEELTGTIKTIIGATEITGPKTYYAKYNAKSYLLTFDMQGGRDGTESTYATYDADMPKIALPTFSGRTFAGYFTSTSGSGTKYYNTDGSSAKTWNLVADNTILYANWQLQSYTVTFDVGDHGTAPESQTIEYGKKVVRPADPTATAYVFDNWYKDKHHINLWLFDSDVVTEDTTLYGAWILKTFVVSFDANGHGTAPESQTIKYKSTVTKPTDPTASGWTFGGWYTEAACTNAYDFTTSVTKSFTLYAKWTASHVTGGYWTISGWHCGDYKASWQSTSTEWSGSASGGPYGIYSSSAKITLNDDDKIYKLTVSVSGDYGATSDGNKTVDYTDVIDGYKTTVNTSGAAGSPSMSFTYHAS